MFGNQLAKLTMTDLDGAICNVYCKTFCNCKKYPYKNLEFKRQAELECTCMIIDFIV